VKSSTKQPKVKQPVASKIPPREAFSDRDLTRVNPLKEQFSPTPAEPVRARYKMAGGC
jgi:hypothetical protein